MKKQIIIGVLSGFIAFASFLGIGYASGTLKIEVIVPTFKWNIDGRTYESVPEKWGYYNGKVNVPSSLLYEGTTYVPIRLAAETLGYQVRWDPNTRTAYIGDEGSFQNQELDTSAIAIIETAKSFMGKTTYQFGAPRYYSPEFNPTVFDCSSFTQYIYSLHGINIDANSRAQAFNGVEVKKSDLQPGDLVFSWNDDTGEGTIGHVAIFMGDNKLIHTWGAPGVNITNFTGTSWEKRFVTARRVIE